MSKAYTGPGMHVTWVCCRSQRLCLDPGSFLVHTFSNNIIIAKKKPQFLHVKSRRIYAFKMGSTSLAREDINFLEHQLPIKRHFAIAKSK
jgi:hypothetical protein